MEVERMRLCDDVITVFNANVDPATRGDVWKATVIRGVSWYRARKQAVEKGRGGLSAAGTCVIRIPADANADDKAYVEGAAYDGEGCWTLRGGDVVARGAFPGGDWTPGRLTEAGAEWVTVTAVTDNRRAPRGRHWQVEGSD